jgi:peroxiredoxin Q/BCP
MTTATPPSQETLPKVGQRVPDFELPDSTGTPRRLSELVAVGPLVLLFYRGHW